MYSQLGQDAWVLERIKHPGYFVEVGAFDGVHLSNTLALEQEGWRGLCIEPEPSAYLALAKNRTCQTANVAIHTKALQQMPFRVDGVFSAIANHRTKKTIQVPATTLEQVLIDYAAPLRIEYISLDTEGNELDILRGFDFAKRQVDLWTVEHNDYTRPTKIRSRSLIKLFAAHGYSHRIVDHDVWFYRD